jgi:hypothetical protein
MLRLTVFLVIVLAASASTARAGSLSFELDVPGHNPTSVACPTGTPSDDICQQLSGTGSARGLGAFSATATLVIGRRPTSGFQSTTTGQITAASGSFTFTGDNSADPAGHLLFSIALTGSGNFATATGSGTLNFIGAEAGNGHFIIDANVNGATATFDTTPPTVTVTHSNATRAGLHRYAVVIHYTATDNATGTLHAEIVGSGSSKPLSSGAATGTAKAFIKVAPGAHRAGIRLVITDASGNTTTRRLNLVLR